MQNMEDKGKITESKESKNFCDQFVLSYLTYYKNHLHYILKEVTEIYLWVTGSLIG